MQHLIFVQGEYIAFIEIVILVFQGHLNVTPKVNCLCNYPFYNRPSWILTVEIGLAM